MSYFQAKAITGGFALPPEESGRKRESAIKFSYDDLTTRLTARALGDRLRLFRLPRLRHLNLIDCEKKHGDFQSCDSDYTLLDQFSRDRPSYSEIKQRHAFVNIFYKFVVYMQDMSTNFEDVPSMCRKIERSVQRMKQCDKHVLYLTFDSILRFYKTRSPQDWRVFVAIVKHLCFSEEMKIRLFKMLLEISFKASCIREIFDVASDNRFNFWTMWERNLNFSTVLFCPVTSVYFQGNLQHLRVLLDYGFRQTHHIRRTLKRILDDDDVPEGALKISSLRKLYSKKVRSQRSSVVIEAVMFIGMLRLRYKSMAMYRMKSYQLAWNARKDPFVTRDEMLDVLENEMGVNSVRLRRANMRTRFLANLTSIQSVVKEYEWEVLKPRSLKHLCRCTIRGALNDNWKMPHGVFKLPLPDKMKVFILLRDKNYSLAIRK